MSHFFTYFVDSAMAFANDCRESTEIYQRKWLGWRFRVRPSCELHVPLNQPLHGSFIHAQKVAEK